MAQSGFTPIKLYLSTTAAAVPTSGNLAAGELAINNNDGKLFYKDSAGVVQTIASKAGASGDVVGPASATANAVPSFNGTTGKLIQDNSGVTIAAGVLTATGVSAAQVDITAQGDLRLQDTTGGEYVALQAPATLAASYTLTMPADDGTAGQALITDGSGVLSWSTAASGDVYGPASATDNAVARFDGTTGKIIQNSAVTIDDTGNVAGVGTLSASGQLTLTNASNYNLYASGAGKNFMQGALGIGAVPASNIISLFGSNNATGAVNVQGIQLSNQIQSDVTTAYYSNNSVASTAAAAFTLATLGHFRATQSTFGAGSTVTNQYGFQAAASLTGATNNYGFYGDIASGTGRWNFYAAGTADNYFAGRVGVGLAASAGIKTRIANDRAVDAFALSIDTYNGASFENSLIAGFNGTNAFFGNFQNFPLNVITNNVTRQVIAANGTISLGAAPGSESLRVTPVASAVNYLSAYGGATAQGPQLRFEGSDTNVNGYYDTKGAGTHLFRTNVYGGAPTQFTVAHTASAVNYLQATGGATGAAATLSAQGSDTNIDLALTPKGTGVLSFGTYTAGIIAQAGYITIKDAGGTTRRLLVG